MMRAATGRIVFLSSVVGEMGNAGQTAYTASKAALLGLTKTLAREYASRGITVNAVAPGFIDTDMTQSLTAEQREALLKADPARSGGDRARDRDRGRVSGLGRGRLRHRPDAPRERRHVHVTQHSNGAK